MAVARKQGDQGQEERGEHRDPALEVEAEQHRSQLQHRSRHGTGVLCGHPWKWPVLDAAEALFFKEHGHQPSHS